MEERGDIQRSIQPPDIMHTTDEVSMDGIYTGLVQTLCANILQQYSMFDHNKKQIQMLYLMRMKANTSISLMIRCYQTYISVSVHVYVGVNNTASPMSILLFNGYIRIIIRICLYAFIRPSLQSQQCYHECFKT